MCLCVCLCGCESVSDSLGPCGFLPVCEYVCACSLCVSVPVSVWLCVYLLWSLCVCVWLWVFAWVMVVGMSGQRSWLSCCSTLPVDKRCLLARKYFIFLIIFARKNFSPFVCAKIRNYRADLFLRTFHKNFKNSALIFSHAKNSENFREDKFSRIATKL